MPIEISCSECDKRLRVKDELAGKKVRCPQCKGVIEVPADGADAAPAATAKKETPKKETPKKEAAKKETPKKETAKKQPAANEESWFVKTDEGEDFGPVPKSELDEWVADGRLNGDCQILIDGGDQWQWASDLYPQLDDAPADDDPLGSAEEPDDDDPLGPTPTQADVDAKAAEEAAKKAAAEKAAAQKVAAEKAAAEKAAAQKAAAEKAKTEKAEAQKQTEPAAKTSAPASKSAEAAKGGMAIGPPPGSEEKPKDDASTGAFNFGIDNSPSARLRGKRRVKKSGAVATTKSPTIKAGGTAAPADGEDAAPAEAGSKKKMIALILCICIWPLGIHRFYLGYTGIGIAQLLTCGGCSIWQIIDLVMIITDKLPDAEGNTLQK